MPLTDATIKNFRLSEGCPSKKLADGDGMYLLVKPSGRYWRMDYRFGEKRKTLALGVYPEVGLKAARAKREEARSLLAGGIDPGEARKAEKLAEKVAAANSFETVAREWVETQRPKWTPRHAVYTVRRLEADIFPAIGHRPMDEITPMEMLEVLRTMEARGTTDLPNRVRAVVGQVFQYGIITAKCDRNPAGDLRGALKAHVVTHQKMVPPEELPDLLRAIEGYDSLAGGDLQTKLALKLLALTFVRTSELRGATWDEINLTTHEWKIPAERMKMKAPHLVPLSRQAVEIILQLQAMNGGFPWVFAGRVPQRPMSENTALFALYRLGYRGRMTGHGFRVVASTILNEQGFRPDVIERQLAHKERNEVRAAYHRSEYLEERRAMMQWWADHLDQLAGANVVPLRKAKG
ncbi:MAG: tyrosine-type recombinase/integrase [Magnetococcales bacterium]|nr:tyrosine-type recombinase/integrase [Magnetococcales bacterium]